MFFTKSDPEDNFDEDESKREAGIFDDDDDEDKLGTCTKRCTYRKTQIHYHCKWVSKGLHIYSKETLCVFEMSTQLTQKV